MQVRRARQPARRRGQRRPDAPSRVVGEEHRAVVRGRVRPAAGRIERHAGRGRTAGRAGLARDELAGSGSRRRTAACGRPAPARVQRLADGQVGAVVAGLARRCPRSRASRSWSPPTVGLTTRLTSSQVFQPVSEIHASFVPGRIVSRNGLRRPVATMRRVSRSAEPIMRVARRRRAGGRVEPQQACRRAGSRRRWSGRPGSACAPPSFGGSVHGFVGLPAGSLP